MTHTSKLLAAAFACLIAWGVPARAVTINFDPAHPGHFTPYTEGAYEFDVARIVNGNCDSASGKPCLALNSNSSPTNPFERSILTRTDGSAFNLNSFWFELLGAPASLTVTSFSGTSLVETIVLNSSTGWSTGGTGHTFFHGFTNITSILFENLVSDEVVCLKYDKSGACTKTEVRKGNIRIDDLNVTSRKDGGPGPSEVPLPGALPFFLAGLAGLGAMARNRKTKLA